MAPEQFLGGEVDRRADIYAFGVLLYQLLAGRLPFEGEDFGQLSTQVVRVPAPRLGSRTPTGERIPRSLRRLVRRCLAKEPERSAAVHGRGGRGARCRSSPRPSRAGRRLVRAAAALGLVAAVVFGLPRLPAGWVPWLHPQPVVVVAAPPPPRCRRP